MYIPPAVAGKKQPEHDPFKGWAFTRRNYLLFGMGVLIIILGYVIMATGDVNSFQALTLAPILLFLGYLVIIPASLLYRDKSAPQGKKAAPKT
ncbi:MAG: DUF3098 domain-containing protein [Fidelibacterota bacterium]